MATNNLAESSFAGMTAQVQVYGRIGMCNVAAVSDMACNGFMHRPTTADDMKRDSRHGIFHWFAQKLQITAVMVVMKQLPATHDYNNRDLELQCASKRERD